MSALSTVSARLLQLQAALTLESHDSGVRLTHGLLQLEEPPTGILPLPEPVAHAGARTADQIVSSLIPTPQTEARPVQTEVPPAIATGHPRRPDRCRPELDQTQFEHQQPDGFGLQSEFNQHPDNFDSQSEIVSQLPDNIIHQPPQSDNFDSPSEIVNQLPDNQLSQSDNFDPQSEIVNQLPDIYTHQRDNSYLQPHNFDQQANNFNQQVHNSNPEIDNYNNYLQVGTSDHLANNNHRQIDQPQQIDQCRQIDTQNYQQPGMGEGNQTQQDPNVNPPPYPDTDETMTQEGPRENKPQRPIKRRRPKVSSSASDSAEVRRLRDRRFRALQNQQDRLETAVGRLTRTCETAWTDLRAFTQKEITNRLQQIDTAWRIQLEGQLAAVAEGVTEIVRRVDDSEVLLGHAQQGHNQLERSVAALQQGVAALGFEQQDRTANLSTIQRQLRDLDQQLQQMAMGNSADQPRSANLPPDLAGRLEGLEASFAELSLLTQSSRAAIGSLARQSDLDRLTEQFTNLYQAQTAIEDQLKQLRTQPLTEDRGVTDVTDCLPAELATLAERVDSLAEKVVQPDVPLSFDNPGL